MGLAPSPSRRRVHHPSPGCDGGLRDRRRTTGAERTALRPCHDTGDHGRTTRGGPGRRGRPGGFREVGRPPGVGERAVAGRGGPHRSRADPGPPRCGARTDPLRREEGRQVQPERRGDEASLDANAIASANDPKLAIKDNLFVEAVGANPSPAVLRLLLASRYDVNAEGGDFPRGRPSPRRARPIRIPRCFER